MEDSLVFELVWRVAIRPRYSRHKKRCADKLHTIVCATRLGTTKEAHLAGLMEVLAYMSNCILIEHGFETPWSTRDRVDLYYPLHVQALDLFRPESRARTSNAL